MHKAHKICTFTFRNGTKLNVAVEFVDAHGNEIPFQAMYQAAQTLCWTGNEEHGRGVVVKFEIGEVITVPTF